MESRSLDDWYRSINGIYLDRNFYRSVESMFSHLVEVTRGVSLAAEAGKRKRNLDPKDFLPKTIAWWMTLCGKVGVPSVEDMVWAKFPGVCPYCRLNPHDSQKCKEREPSRAQIDWSALKDISAVRHRPRTIRDWQKLFNDIYPRTELTTHDFGSRRLQEEIGELAEAVRVLPIAPEYFVSEAPDVFAWLMGFANQFDFDDRVPSQQFGVALDTLLERTYPGRCEKCGWTVCKCPPVPSDTLGRLAREAPMGQVFPGRNSLFTAAECSVFFAAVEAKVRLGDAEVSLTKDELRNIASDVQTLLGLVGNHLDVERVLTAKVVVTLATVQALAKQGTLTSNEVHDLVEWVRGMPSEERGILTGAITNFASSATFAALLELAKASVL